MTAVSWLAFLVILYHALRAAHRSSYCHWCGPRWRFVALAMGFACATSGSLGIALAVPWADSLFASGAALYLLGNRRHCIAECPRRPPRIRAPPRTAAMNRQATHGIVRSAAGLLMLALRLARFLIKLRPKK